jgi:ADP-ribose pyrophosphatase YjhB (NUDIX family)
MSYLSDLRGLVGHRPLQMVTATVFVLDGQDRLLLLKRSDNQCWGPPGGAVELNETIEDAAQRETREETGLDIQALKLFGVFSGPEMAYRYPNGDEVYVVSVTYVAREPGTGIRLSEEHTEWGRFPLGRLPSPVSPPIVPIMKKFIEDFGART